MLRFINSKGMKNQTVFAKSIGRTKSTLSKWQDNGIPYDALKEIWNTYGEDFPFEECGINPYTFFGLNIQYIEPEFYSLKNNYVDNVKFYFEALKAQINETQKELSVYNYLGRTINESFKNVASLAKEKLFHGLQAEYFSDILKRFKEQPITYNRILVLPLKIDIIEKDVEFCLEKAIRLMLFEEFKHICYCFEVNKNKPVSSFHLFLSASPPVLDSFACLDTHTLIKECDTYNEKGTPSPNMIFLYKTPPNLKDADTHTKKIIQHYKNEIVNLLIEGNNRDAPVWKISLDEFIANSKELLKKAEIEIANYPDKKNVKSQFKQVIEKKGLESNLSDLLEKNDFIKKIFE